MLTIQPICAFSDNYIWLIFDQDSRQAFVVDPGDATPVLAALRAQQLDLAGILITHHHFDHVGGLEQLCAAFNPVVYGPRNPAISGLSQTLGAGDQIEVLGDEFSILEVPGHTLDHIAYFHRGEEPVLFCGDTLFAGGCGRVFEGSYEMMHKSLQKLAALSPQTQVFCAHEYTMANLAFARAVSPEFQPLAERIVLEQGKRDQALATVPTSIKKELGTNPFLRCDDEHVRLSAEQKVSSSLDNPEQVFAVLREWKDSF